MPNVFTEIGDAAGEIFNETKEEIIAGSTAFALQAIQQYHPIQTLMPDIMRLVKDLWNADHLTGVEKHAKVMADLQKIEGEIGSIAVGVIEGALGFLLSTAISVAHAYIKTHLEERFVQG